MADRKPRILAIDDTPANLQTLGAALAGEFDLQMANSGKMGLALAGQFLPDLILLDVMMPEMDGYETCRRLKADPRLRAVPVIFLTAMSDLASESKGLALGAADYLTKPIRVEIARQRIRNLLEREELRKSVESHRDHLEQLVATRTAQLSAVFSLSPDGFLSFAPDGRVIHVNSAFTRMTGLREENLLGADQDAISGMLLELCLPSARFLGVDELNRRLGAEESGDGERLCLELAVPVGRVLEVRRRQGSGEELAQVLYFRDISHMSEVDRMKSEFLSLAAHELRTPMVSIYGFSEAMLTQEFDAEALRELLSTIHRQAEVMSSIIDDLVDLAAIEARHGRDFVLEDVNLFDMVNDLVSSATCPAGRAPAAVVSPDRILSVSADRAKIGQAFRHVLANAYAYSPAGGGVSIGFREMAKGDRLMLGIAIRDCGIGMNPEQQRRCSERFYRGDMSGKTPGTGLGLSITMEIVDIHRGHVEIESEPGQGTTVTIWLPEVSSKSVQ